jgi:CheY-like chemotaxis protein
MNTKILIVEDEDIIRQAYADELADNGFSVLAGKNGQEGLELARQYQPDLILLDILMPVMDGLTMMNTLRQEDAYGKKVPIILLTNLSAGEENIMKAITKSEPAYYLIKSDWNLSQVVQKIKDLLAQSVATNAATTN